MSAGGHGDSALRLLAPLAVVTALAVLSPITADAQFPGFGGPARPQGPARDVAPIDLTGYWVAIVNEDWRWRMVTPPKGDYSSLSMLNAAGRQVADAWDPAEDGSCKAYGAAALLRMPTRLRIDWAEPDVLLLETDAGQQARLFLFAPSAELAPGTASLQGHSIAEWVFAQRPPGRPRPGAAPPAGGSLKVTTTNLSPGWLRRNGVPYSVETTVTEYFDRFAAPNGDEWLVATVVVEDPVYLTGRFVTSSHFRREPDDNGWNPTSCRND